MKKTYLILPLISLLLTSCSKGYIRYGVKKPYIELETVNETKGILKNILPSEAIKKIENEDTFMLYIHSNTCSHCQESKETFLYPYLESHKVIIYGLEQTSFISNEEEKNIYINSIRPNLTNLKGVPYYALYQNGVFIKGEQDSAYFSLFFDTYIITENN